jgi:hypothetical protein
VENGVITFARCRLHRERPSDARVCAGSRSIPSAKTLRPHGRAHQAPAPLVESRAGQTLRKTWILDRYASVAVGVQPGGSNSTSSYAAGCSRICSGLGGPGCVQSTPGVCHSMPRAWKQRMRRATALSGPGGSSPRVRAGSSSLLATLTTATATISALMAIARMMNGKATIMLTFQRCADGSPSPVSGGKTRKTLRGGRVVRPGSSATE